MRRFFFPLALAICVQPALADAPKVITDIAPIHALVTQVMGDRGTPEVLLPAGGDPHDFQLRPSQARALADAELIVWMGEALSPWLERGLDGVGSKAVQLELLEAKGTVTRSFGEAGEEAGGAHDHTHEAHNHEGHNHEGLDPHAWLDPENGRIWLGLIAEALAQADPEGAATYRANEIEGRSVIDAAEATARATLAPVQDKPFAVLHDAYGYYADHFGLTIVGALRMGDAAQPGAAHVRDLQAELQASGAACIFPEANHDSAMVEQMAQAAGVRMGAALDPSGANTNPGAGLYAAVLVGMATDIAACLADR
jgi:zinc transport system substrate-binding protein